MTNETNKDGKPKDREWLVLQSESGDSAFGGLWMAATRFQDHASAEKFVEHVLRKEWQVVIDADEGGNTLLADKRGYVYPKDSVKWSDVYYSEDGAEAWARTDDGVERVIRIVPMRWFGDRMS